MKKLGFLSLAILFVIEVFFGLYLLSQNIEEERFSSTKFETLMEMEKDYQFVKIISIPESEKLTAVDCYGRQLEKWEWYIHSKSAGTFCPVSYEIYSWGDYENADAVGKYSAFKATGQVKSDTVDISCPAYGKNSTAYRQNVRTKILTFSKRFIKFGFDGQKPIYWIEGQKLEKNEKTGE